MKKLEDKLQIRDLVYNYVCGESKIGLVPTVGNIHEGHIAMIKKAREMSEIVAVCLFAHPFIIKDSGVLEFFFDNRPSDFELLENADVDYVFAPPMEVLYHKDYKTFVTPERILERFAELESSSYITGLATVLFQNLNLFKPTFYFIEQKNYLDYSILKSIIHDYGFNTEPVICPTVRDENGVAYTSFLPFLSRANVESAKKIYVALRKARQMLMEDVTDSNVIKEEMKKIMIEEEKFKVMYMEIMNPSTLDKLETANTEEVLIIVTVELNGFRLTDNIIFRRDK